ncbi:peptidyl-prolyl cis-trans isomerase [Planctomycetota bacterium]|nr:peptidyl-prolyl cis-trans isomerase [Planctomycetota bacterium]
MIRKTTPCLLLLAAFFIPACQSASYKVDSPTAVDRTASKQTIETRSGTGRKLSANIAYINGLPVPSSSLMPTMYEIAGGEALANTVIDQGIKEELALMRIPITDTMVQQEKQLILDNLSPNDENEAVRLLSQLRKQRGLGDHNFQAMLTRNAGLRAIVQDDVKLSERLLQQEYALRFGEKYQARLIVTPDLKSLKLLRNRIISGESFSDLAGANSTDISSRQGGLLSPISLADTNYPSTIRTELAKLKVGSLSQAIAIDNGYALLKLERIFPASELEYDQVKEQIRQSLRLRIEATLMRQKAAEYVAKAKVTILQPNLLESWKRKKLEYTQPQ